MYHHDGASGPCYKCIEEDKNVATKKVVVKQVPEKPVEVEVLAAAIVEIGKAAKRLAASNLNRKAVIVLLSHQTGLGQGVIKTVLDGIADLESTYLRK
jgi:hypothetical protein